MNDQTRQYAETINGIRPDHVIRYAFAAQRLEGKRVLDLACGCGYGSWILHKVGNEVTGVDIEPEAIEYAQRYYEGPTYICQAGEEVKGSWDALVSFETLEHLEDPLGLLRAIQAPLLIASVPNEEFYPFISSMFAEDKYPHKRHYTPTQFEQMLNAAGYEVTERFCQPTKMGDMKAGTEGRFLVYVGSRLP